MKKHLISLLVLFLLVSSSVVGVSNQLRQEIIEKTSLPLSRGNWFFVGGNGPRNYTKIQDAINASSDGDTVFVYAYSSPYYENLIVNTSINLMGEERNTTIINGKKMNDTIWIRASFVNVSGFTIVNSSTKEGSAGIFIIEKKWWELSNPPWLTNIRISNCIIKNNNVGIWSVNVDILNISFCSIHNNPSHSIYLTPSSQVNVKNCEIIHNGDIYPGAIIIAQDDRIGISENITISNCSISDNVLAGIWIIEHSKNIEIHHNIIFENTNYGIDVFESNVKIYNNYIFNNGNDKDWGGGVYLQNCIKCITINDNNIESNNQYGLLLLRSSINCIIKNNFINNTVNAYFQHFSLLNHWNGNHWTDWIGVGPKLIKGKLGEVFIPWVNFDWHPAQEPYDIPGMT